MKHTGNLVVGPSIHAISSVCLMFCHHQWIHRSCILHFAYTQRHQLRFAHTAEDILEGVQRNAHMAHLTCIQQTLWHYEIKEL